VRIEIVAALVEKALGSRLQDAVAEALADEAALAVAAVRVEAVANDAPPVARTVSVTTATRLAVIFEKSM